MIICSAIQYKINKTDKAVTLCGLRHTDIIKQLKLLGLNPQDYTEISLGLINHKNEFLDRYAAYKEAKQCGQLPVTVLVSKESYGKYRLYSEDLF